MTNRPRGPTGTIAKLYAESLRDVERNQAIIDMQAKQIAALKKCLATPLPCRCWWCRLADWVMEVRYGKPV